MQKDNLICFSPFLNSWSHSVNFMHDVYQLYLFYAKSVVCAVLWIQITKHSDVGRSRNKTRVYCGITPNSSIRTKCCGLYLAPKQKRFNNAVSNCRCTNSRGRTLCVFTVETHDSRCLFNKIRGGHVELNVWIYLSELSYWKLNSQSD